MEGSATTRDLLEELIAESLTHMDDMVQTAWHAMDIEPEKWQCSPWGDNMAATTVPSDLEQSGTITRRQTTYWELLSGAGHLWRMHFKSKTELRFDKPDFSHIELVDEHPVLEQYVEPWDQLTTQAR